MHPNLLRLEDRSKCPKDNLVRIINICKILVDHVTTDKSCITGLHLLRISFPIFGYFNSLSKKTQPHAAGEKRSAPGDSQDQSGTSFSQQTDHDEKGDRKKAKPPRW
jgi:hypothetical protein